MRFHADGPDIPLELIEARDAGQVIFLCGAGISMPAGLPSFWRLTREVIEDLGVPPTDRAGLLMRRAVAESDPALAPPLDQVFGVLKQDYGVGHVEDAVAKRLRLKRAPDTRRHETILRLASDPQGRRRVITTNFDRLFEISDRRLAWLVPPALPDLDYAPTIEGVVYLHGRLPQPGVRGPMGLVLGSSDFGRAYLAEGWATRFIRQILDRYTLVLVGYSADDPPVRYLLEGLHAIGSERQATLYAFTEGEQADADARWRERGVRPIVYRAGDDGHGGLWRSLESWAEQADDPAAWRSAITRLAACPPASLASYERGQVAALVSTPLGAKIFAEAEPPPPAEWLCVFDRHVRLGKPYRPTMTQDQGFRDPRDAYGLDADLGPDDSDSPRLDLLRPLAFEQSGASFSGLTLLSPGQPPALPPRLFQLTWWLAKVVSQPAALWWASGQSALHPTVVDLIDRQLGFLSVEENQAPIAAWRLLFEALQNPPSEYRSDWHDLRTRVAKTGWTRGELRALTSVLRPRLTVARPQYAPPFPPETFEPRQAVLELDVAFLEAASDELDFDVAMLAPIVAAWRQALLVGVDLLNETSPLGWSTPTLIPDDGPGERYFDAPATFFLNFAQLFERLVEHDPAAAMIELSSWPPEDPFFFNKLRIWAWRRAELIDGAGVAANLLGLGETGFWGERRDRELLWTLRARWPDFDEAARRAIEARLVEGPAPDDDELPDEYLRRRSNSSATRLGWLQLQGCALSPETLAALPGLRAGDSRWVPSWDEHAADSWEGGVYSVQQDPDPEPLLAAPLSNLAELAQAAERRDEFGPRRAVPFVGLIKTKPALALATLAFEHRAGRHPQRLWSQFLSVDGVALTPRLRRLVAARLCRLSDSALVALRFEVARWISENIVALASVDPDLAWSLWDRHSEALIGSGDAALRSAIGDRTVGGVVQPQSRKTYEKAINGPIGILARAALKVLSAGSPGPALGLPEEIRSRLVRALAAPCEGGDHAAAVLARDMVWLDAIDPNFVEQHLVTMMQPDALHLEAAWSGYLASGRLLSAKRFAILKPAFLALFEVAGTWTWSAPALARMADFLVVMTLERSRYLTPTEARRALQMGGEEACAGAANSLVRRLNKGRDWPAVKRFLIVAWPKELRLSTTALSKRLADLPSLAGDAFVEAVDTVLPFLRPFDQVDMFVHRVARNGEDERAPVERYPHACLRLLDAVIAPSPPRPPHDLGRVLGLLAEAAPELRMTASWRRLQALTI